MNHNVGFTLIELMIALVVIATISGAVFTRTSETVTQLSSIERRTFASWVAENEMERLRLGRLTSDLPIPVGTTASQITLGNQDWKILRNVQATSHPWLRRAQFTVFALVNGMEVGPLDTVTTFVGRY